MYVYKFPQTVYTKYLFEGKEFLEGFFMKNQLLNMKNKYCLFL